MNKPLRILHLEDEPDYVELVKSLLAAGGLTVEVVLVASRIEFEAALAQPFDVILADYQLPGFNGLDALRLAQQRCPETPFLLLSGVIGEQVAIESLKCGATDYVLKQWIERLVPAVRRAIEEAHERLQRRQAERELVRRERYFRTLTENCVDILTILDREGRYVFNSPSLTRVLGYEPKALQGRSPFEIIHPDDAGRVRATLEESLRRPDWVGTVEARFRHLDGSWRHLEAVGQNRLDDPDVCGFLVNSRDITDRKRAEASLRESEAQYRLIFDNNPTPMWVFDHETLAFLEVNDAALQHYGYSREEFLQMTMRDIRPQEDVPAMIEYFHKLRGGHGSTRMDLTGVWRHRKKDGTFIEVELKWCPISFKGRPASLNMANDVTERRRIEHRDAAFAKLGQRLSSATSPLEAAQIIKAVADDLFAWDAFMLNHYSAERGKLCPLLNVDTDRQGRRLEMPVLGEEREPSKTVRRVIAQGAELLLRPLPLPDSVPAEFTPIGDQTRASASLMFAPIRNRTKVIGLLSVQSYTANAFSRKDLDTLQTLADHCGGALERIRAEQALHESEMLFHSVWQNSVDGMRLTDEAGTIVFANEAFCRLVGLSRDQLEGQPLTVIYGPAEDPERLLGRYRKDFQQRVIEHQVERKLVRRDGTVVVLEETSSFVNLQGRPSLRFGLFRDVTAQKRLEDQLRQSQKMEAIGQLAGGVAHDFNNILTVIHGHASLLQAGGALPPLAARSAQQIAQAADRAAGLTRQLLAFSRRQVMQLRRLDLNEVVTNMTKMLGRILGEDIALQLHYLSQPALVQADAGMMEQVLLNLAVNARDAMPKGGLLIIKITLHDLKPPSNGADPRSGRFICVAVSDTGCGIAPENLRRVFEPFFTTKEVGKGTGLGLATVYGIVKQHQGWVDVDSELGKGSRFCVYLPLCAPETGSAVHEAEAEPEVRGGTETILVVEDETAVRDLVCNILASKGYHILQANSGLQAIDVWREHREKVDLVLTDLVMPDRMNGRELAEKLWSERPKLKVIFTSGYSADAVGKDFILNQDLNYLQKPYQPKKLARAVRECLDRV